MKTATACALGALGVTVVLLVAYNWPTGTTATNSTGSVAHVEAPSAPEHRWNYKDGFEYGYESALSDDAKKAGQAVSNVIMYRYLGEKNGVFTLQSKTNGITTTVSCTNPCELIKARTSIAGLGGSTERIPFSLDTIIGSALTDAFNGQLEVYHPPTAGSANETE